MRGHEPIGYKDDSHCCDLPLVSIFSEVASQIGGTYLRAFAIANWFFLFNMSALLMVIGNLAEIDTYAVNTNKKRAVCLS